MWLFLKPFWPLIWRAAAALIVVLFVWWAWAHFVSGPYIAQGVAKEHVNTQAAINRATAAEAANKTFKADLDVLEGRYKDQGLKVVALEVATKKAQAATKAAKEALKKKEALYQSDLAY